MPTGPTGAAGGWAETLTGSGLARVLLRSSSGPAQVLLRSSSGPTGPKLLSSAQGSSDGSGRNTKNQESVSGGPPLLLQGSADLRAFLPPGGQLTGQQGHSSCVFEEGRRRHVFWRVLARWTAPLYLDATSLCVG